MRYKPEIFIPDPWTIYQVRIQPSTPVPTIMITPPEPDLEPLTMTQLCLRYPLPYCVSTDELLDDLYLSPSDTSISSTETCCLDETTNPTQEVAEVRVYNAFS